MRDFKSHMKVVSRRISYLRNKTNSRSASSYDRAEVSSLEAMARVATIYNDARDGGSHIENILYMVSDVIEETLEENDLDEQTSGRLEDAFDKCSAGISLLRKLHK